MFSFAFSRRKQSNKLRIILNCSVFFCLLFFFKRKVGEKSKKDLQRRKKCDIIASEYENAMMKSASWICALQRDRLGWKRLCATMMAFPFGASPVKIGSGGREAPLYAVKVLALREAGI